MPCSRTNRRRKDFNNAPVLPRLPVFDKDKQHRADSGRHEDTSTGGEDMVGIQRETGRMRVIRKSSMQGPISPAVLALHQVEAVDFPLVAAQYIAPSCSTNDWGTRRSASS